MQITTAQNELVFSAIEEVLLPYINLFYAANFMSKEVEKGKICAFIELTVGAILLPTYSATEDRVFSL